MNLLFKRFANPCRTWTGFICSALVAMIYEKSAGKEEREEGEEERGVELLKHVRRGEKA